MADSVEVKGADRVAATLRSAARKIENLDAADRRVAASLAQQARSRAPKRTGRLARSTVGIPSPEGGARVQATVIYAGVIHNGWRRHNITPNPFIRDAVEAGVTQAASTYAQECQQALNTVKGV
jgi:hypothetical protein